MFNPRTVIELRDFLNHSQLYNSTVYLDSRHVSGGWMTILYRIKDNEIYFAGIGVGPDRKTAEQNALFDGTTLQLIVIDGSIDGMMELDTAWDNFVNAGRPTCRTRRT